MMIMMTMMTEDPDGDDDEDNDFCLSLCNILVWKITFKLTVEIYNCGISAKFCLENSNIHLFIVSSLYLGMSTILLRLVYLFVSTEPRV